MKNKVLIMALSILLVSVLPFSCAQDETPTSSPLPTLTPTNTPTPTPTPTPKPSTTPTSKPTASPTPEATEPEITEEPTPKATRHPTATPKGTQAGTNWVFIGEIVAAAAVLSVVGAFGFVFSKRRRVNEKSLRRLSSSEFQNWVLKRLDGKPATSKDIALGIDGFSRLNEPISIKQTDSVGMVAVDSFAASLAKNRARSGIMVAFDFSDDAVRGKVRARMNYRLDIQMMTVRELIQGKRQSY
jgi:hypothetical protein